MVLKSMFNPLSSTSNARRFYALRGDATECGLAC